MVEIRSRMETVAEKFRGVTRLGDLEFEGPIVADIVTEVDAMIP